MENGNNIDPIKEMLQHYINAEKELMSMNNFLDEAWRYECSLIDTYQKSPSKELMARYGLARGKSKAPVVWYILEQFAKGNFVMKEQEAENGK